METLNTTLGLLDKNPMAIGFKNQERYEWRVGNPSHECAVAWQRHSLPAINWSPTNGVDKELGVVGGLVVQRCDGGNPLMMCSSL